MAVYSPTALSPNDLKVESPFLNHSDATESPTLGLDDFHAPRSTRKASTWYLPETLINETDSASVSSAEHDTMSTYNVDFVTSFSTERAHPSESPSCAGSPLSRESPPCPSWTSPRHMPFIHSEAPRTEPYISRPFERRASGYSPYIPPVQAAPIVEPGAFRSRSFSGTIPTSYHGRLGLPSHTLPKWHDPVYGSLQSYPRTMYPSLTSSQIAIKSTCSPTMRPSPRKRTSREEANFQCDVRGCGKFFSRSYNYKSHMETHDEKRTYPFPCSFNGCEKKFVRKTDLQRHHQSVHMKDRSHKCDYCGRLFARKDTLRRHMDDGCPKRFDIGTLDLQAYAGHYSIAA